MTEVQIICQNCLKWITDELPISLLLQCPYCGSSKGFTIIEENLK